MIIWILLIALIVTVAAILLGVVFGRAKNKSYRKGLYVGIAICVGLITFCLILGGIYNSELNELKSNYNDIMLYNEVVELCENEQVRFGHYEKIEAYNDAYDSFAISAENFMFGTLIPTDWSEDIGKIDFYFRGVDYGYEG